MADLQRVDRAIRPGVSNRALIKSGSIEAWDACLSSLQDTTQILLDSSFADQNGSAAIWIHWRKSGTSKQLLGLLRAVVEDAPCSAVAAGCVRESALHFGLVVISFLFERTQLGALWPAMREWIVDQGGLQTIWQALAWSMALVGEDQAVHDVALRGPVQTVVGLMTRPEGAEAVFPFPHSAHPSITAALTLLFSGLLPRDLASGTSAHGWPMQEVLGSVNIICDQLSSFKPQPQLHQAILISWPHCMGWLRLQPSLDLEYLAVRFSDFVIVWCRSEGVDTHNPLV